MNNFTRIQRGICYMEMSSYDLALAEFDWVLDVDLLNTRALFQRALLRMNNKEAFSAIQDFDKIIEISPDNVSAIFNRAIAKSQLEDYAGAIEDYDLIIQTHDDNMLAYYNRAGAKSNRGDLDGAIQDYTKVIDLCPDYADAYYARSMVEKKKDNNRNAEKDYLLADSLSQAFSLMDDSLSTKNAFKLLKMVTLSGDMSDDKKEEGRIQYKHVDILVKPYYQIAPFPQSDLKATYYDATGKNHYGWKLVELIRASDSIPTDRVQQEIDSLDITTRDQNSGIAYLVRRATLYTYQENFNKAFSDFDMAIALDTNNLPAYFGRANARLKLKELITDFEPQTTTLAGESMNTGVAGSYSGHPYAEIIADYNKVIELDKNFPYAYYNSSYALCLAGEYDEAIKNLSKTIELKPAFADAYFNRGITYLYLKNTEQACPDLSKAAELGVVEAYNIILRYCNR
ncbi:MAG: tetratricopeptide repeat protein [Bacteroidales bacterium]|nr:tetratricopeptide repeat protein [Bacteroidales bacterium]MCF8457088.1 tetratricopeptide repeat protein [Bacteroidales bacterium]